jgi:hypothetical protein
LPFFSKIWEKLMHKRLLAYLNSYSILTDRQFGFREKYSTYMAMLNLVDQISGALESKKYTLGVFIDLSKAFDTIVGSECAQGSASRSPAKRRPR